MNGLSLRERRVYRAACVGIGPYCGASCRGAVERVSIGQGRTGPRFSVSTPCLPKLSSRWGRPIGRNRMELQEGRGGNDPIARLFSRRSPRSAGKDPRDFSPVESRARRTRCPARRCPPPRQGIGWVGAISPRRHRSPGGLRAGGRAPSHRSTAPAGSEDQHIRNSAPCAAR